MGPCHQLNWSTSFYKTPKLKAFISFAAIPDQDTVKSFYAVTISDHDNLEIYQEDYSDLARALDILNERYKHWEFVEMGQANKSAHGDGCSSCAAH
jgi:hypothetical protein